MSRTERRLLAELRALRRSIRLNRRVLNELLEYLANGQSL